jgi:hypothetical protein
VARQPHPLGLPNPAMSPQESEQLLRFQSGGDFPTGEDFPAKTSSQDPGEAYCGAPPEHPNVSPTLDKKLYGRGLAPTKAANPDVDTCEPTESAYVQSAEAAIWQPLKRKIRTSKS